MVFSISTYVQQALESAPPLSDEKRDKITALFQAGDRP